METGNFEDERRAIINGGNSLDAWYEKALDEIDSGKQVRAIWARALADSGGDDEKARSIYIKRRVSELRAASSEEGIEESKISAVPPSVESNNVELGRPVTFQRAVTICLSKYATFEGVANRAEFWWFFLFYNIVQSLLVFLLSSGMPRWILLALTVVTSAPLIAVSVRRLHDINMRGWHLLIGLIPLFGAVLLIYFFCKDSEPQHSLGGRFSKAQNEEEDHWDAYCPNCHLVLMASDTDCRGCGASFVAHGGWKPVPRVGAK